MNFRLLVFFLILPLPCLGMENVLVVTIDTLRSDHVACYGSTKVKTPNIDSLASRGVLFKNAVSAVPFTLPSHVSIFTGLIPPVHGVEDNGGFYLDKKIETMATVFRAKGVKTAAFVGAFPLDSRFGLDRGFSLYDDSYPTLNNVSEMEMPERNAGRVTDAALKWLGGQLKSRWFVWIHYYDPHFPYTPPDPFGRLYRDDPYSGEVAYTDQQLGRVLDFLKKNHLETKTLVVLVSDHGESLGEHQEKTHGIFGYQSTLHVPFIIAPFPPRTIDTRVRLVDVAPTVLALQGLSFSGKIQGVSLAKFLTTAEAPPLQDSYFEALSMFFNVNWAPLRGFYSGNYKYISLPIPELYDLVKDPKETTNLCGDKQLCDKWAARFSAFSKPYVKTGVAPSQVDSETAEQLRALGYVSGTSGGRSKKDFGPKDDPKNLISLHNKIDSAMSYYNKGDHGGALQILQGVMKARPEYSIAYMHASYIQNEEGSPEKAVETLRAAIRNGVTGPDVEAKMGLYLYEMENYPEAIKHIMLAVRQDPKDLDNLNYLGMAYTDSGNFAEAESTFQKGLAIDPSDAMTINNLGTLYLKQKKFELAATTFNRAIAANPHTASAYNGLGVVYATRQNWDLAIKNWSLAVAENNKNFDAMLNLGYAYLQKNDRQKALDTLKNFLDHAPPVRYAEDLVKVRDLVGKLQQVKSQ